MAEKQRHSLESSQFFCNSRENLESFTCIWLDQHVYTSAENRQILQNLRYAINHLQVFDDIRSCIDYIRSVTTEKIILISSGALGRKILPDIFHLSQLCACYIFCENVLLHQQWSRGYLKVIDVFNDFNELLSAVKRDQIIRDKIEERATVSIINPTCDSVDSRHAIFMWFQLFIDVLIRMQQKSNDIENIVEVCKNIYQNNVQEMGVINEFERMYRSEDAIRWYTRDACFYRIINKALRTQNYDVLLTFRCFISDIAKQIKGLHDDFMRTTASREKKRVFRGEAMKTTELELLRKNIGAFVSMNHFVSTSENESVAVEFALENLSNAKLELVLYDIEIDPCLPTKAFAFLKDRTDFPGEEEVLFMLGTMFRIKNVIEKSSGQLCRIELILVSENDIALKNLFHHMRNEIGNDAHWDSLGKILIEMGEYEQATKCYQRLTNEAKLTLADAESGLGHVDWRSHKNTQSLEHHHEALKIRQQLLDTNHEKIAESLSFIGGAYWSEKNYSQALTHLQKALEIQIKLGLSGRIALSKTYTRIASVFEAMNNNVEAENFYRRTLEIQRETLPEDHPQIASSYNNIGCILFKARNYLGALGYFEQCLQIRKKILPTDHRDLLAIEKNVQITFCKVYPSKEIPQYLS